MVVVDCLPAVLIRVKSLVRNALGYAALKSYAMTLTGPWFLGLGLELRLELACDFPVVFSWSE